MSRVDGGRQTSELLDTAERRVYVLRMRKAGATYEEIAEAATAKFGIEQLPKGWDERYAWKDVKRELDKLCEDITEDTEAVRQLELERLNDMLKALWSRATNKDSDYKAVDRVLKIMRRRAELMGLDAPKNNRNFDINLTTLTDHQLERIARGEDVLDVLTS